jgi:hypothetical protein
VLSIVDLGTTSSKSLVARGQLLPQVRRRIKRSADKLPHESVGNQLGNAVKDALVTEEKW